MAFTHDACGTLYEGRVPPYEGCEYCARFAVFGLSDPKKGWHHVVGTPGGQKARKRAEAKERRRRNQNKRRRIGPTRRERIYKRDDYTCQGPCGRRLPPEDEGHRLLTLDHKIPVSKGGTNRDNNLQTMCRSCNGKKGNKLPPDVDEAALKAARKRTRLAHRAPAAVAATV